MSKISDTAMEFVCTTASSFVSLQLESDIKSESGEDRSGQGAGISQASEDICSTNEKKRKKRRRKKKQQQSGVNELTSEMFEADLEKALLLSKLEHEEHKKEYENMECTSPQSKSVDKKGKRKNQQGEDKPLTVTLKDFQSDNSTDSVAKKHETLVNDGGFFRKLEGDVHKILKREKRRNQLTDCNEIDNCRSHEHNQESGMKGGKTEQLKLELEKKDAEIQQLKNIVTQWEAKYKKAKARNAQLKMLQEGEMKDKAEILLLVNELHILKNELALQVTTLSAALEQERSKVKLLQAELTKYQSGKRGKKCLQSD